MPLSIIAESANEAFIKVAEKLNKDSDFICSPRKWETMEIIGSFIVINNPYDRLVTNVHRKISLKYLVGEWLWYERGSNSMEEISHYSNFWRGISDDKTNINSAYGNRILGISPYIGINQWNWVKKQLIIDKETRRAIIFIASSKDMKHKTKDFPCTVSLQFLIRNNELYLISNMRSNDLILGFTYDVPSFTLFQEKMLLELKKFYPNLEMGKYIHVVGSIHVYKKHYNMIKNILNDANNNLKVQMPRMANLNEIKKLQYNEKIIRNNEKRKLRKISDEFCLWCQNVLINNIKI